MGSPIERVAIATFGRSDFSILQNLARKLHASPDFEVGWWAGGAHFEALSGRTIDDVLNSGVPLWGTVDGGSYERSELSTVEMMAKQLDGFGHLAAGRSTELAERLPGAQRPDLVIILGDRFEAASAGLAMVPLRVPVAHISGGSVTEGAIDDVFRHCLTKIAALHFCDLPEFARRIQLMGESPNRIVTTGALGLDAFCATPIRTFAEFVGHFHFHGLRPGFALVTLHPESQRPAVNRPMAEAMVEALAKFERQVVFTYPNADAGSDAIIEVLERAATRPGCYLFKSFGADWFPSAMAYAGCMVGNSSGGIIEAASFALPVLDIGDRQSGRAHGPNVVRCGRQTVDISEALREITDPAFATRAAAANIYGDGHGAERVIEKLRNVDISMLRQPKRFARPDPDFVGERAAWR